MVGRGDSATGRRIPAGTTGDVNQWVIRAAVPQEGESRPCILHNSRKEDGESRVVGFLPEKGGSFLHGNASFKNYLFVDFRRKFSPLSGPGSVVLLSTAFASHP